MTLAEALARLGADVERRASPPEPPSAGTTSASASRSKAAAATTSTGSSTWNRERSSAQQAPLAIFPPTSTESARPPRCCEHAELVLDLGAARDEHERPLDVAEQAAEHLELLLQQQARVGGQQLGDADGGRVRAVRRAEGVVHVEVHARRQLARELRVVPGLARVEAGVLEHAHARVGEQLAQARRNGRDRVRGIRPLRPSQVRADGDLGGPALEQQLERRQGRPDPRVVRHAPVLERHVEVGAQEHALPRDVGVADASAACALGLDYDGNRARSAQSRRAGSCSPTRCRTSRTPSPSARGPSSAASRRCTSRPTR